MVEKHLIKLEQSQHKLKELADVSWDEYIKHMQYYLIWTTS